MWLVENKIRRAERIKRENFEEGSLEDEGEAHFRGDVRGIVGHTKSDAEIDRRFLVDRPIGADFDIGAVQEGSIDFLSGCLELFCDTVIKGEVDGGLVTERDGHPQAVADGAAGFDVTNAGNILTKGVGVAQATEDNGRVTGFSSYERAAYRVVSRSPNR